MGINDLKSRVQGICERQGVIRLDLFGSRARSHELEGNDYDFIAELTPGSPADYSRHFFGLLHALEDELHAPVDLMTYKSLKKRSLKQRIHRDRVPVYER